MGQKTELDSPMETYKRLSNNTHRNWVRDKGLRKLNLGIMFMLSSSAGTGFTSSLINGLLVLPEFETLIGGLKESVLGLIIAALSLGAILSFVPASYVADILGRKICVCLGSILVITAALVQISIPHHWVFFGMRVVAGFGVGISQTAAPLLTTEVAHPRHRQTFTAIYNACWSFGAIISASVIFGTLPIASSWSWRIPCMLQTFYPTVQLVGLCFVPESPRWLVSKNRKEEALDMLAKYHANGDKDDELVQHEYQQICNSIGETGIKARSWSSFVSTRGDIHRLSICVLVGIMQEWAGNGIISFYLAPILDSVGITDASDQASINVSLQIWNFILSIAGAIASERFGRRIMWLTATAMMFTFLSITTIVAALFAERDIPEAGVAVVPMLFLFFGSYDLAYAPLFIAYPAEILPFQLRAKGLAITLTTDAIACFFNQYVNPIAFAALQWKYFCLYVGTLSMFFALVYFLFPETKGRSLEEVSEIFDRKNNNTVRVEEVLPPK
ncbi:hypothetical protein N7474_009547 [Penicillium riverlandense]|uniref:uncharacterized protein n=1 Tax=Penicillium riverlandense TaxID=1903569 RepID=UPI00254972B7|nr:uncharacterized protein N7474_009547 [Penicillium riverlandense]KAJ5808278.1 hypothetical protein N7474_009547 [Penicillium riverlandense]